MRPIGDARELEKRRVKAIELLSDGLGPYLVARRLGVAPKTVYRWRDAYNDAGRDGLKPIPHPGAKPKLTAAQKRRLTQLLLKGALHFGYPNALWTMRRIAHLIKREFGVAYHFAHMSRLLAALGWSCQKPARRSKQRDDKAVQNWVLKEWPRIKKASSRKERSSPSSTRAASRQRRSSRGPGRPSARHLS